MWEMLAIAEGALLLLIGLGLWAANRGLDNEHNF